MYSEVAALDELIVSIVILIFAGYGVRVATIFHLVRDTSKLIAVGMPRLGSGI